jgi:hypothetical protein
MQVSSPEGGERGQLLAAVSFDELDQMQLTFDPRAGDCARAGAGSCVPESGLGRAGWGEGAVSFCFEKRERHMLKMAMPASDGMRSEARAIHMANGF